MRTENAIDMRKEWRRMMAIEYVEPISHSNYMVEWKSRIYFNINASMYTFTLILFNFSYEYVPSHVYTLDLVLELNFHYDVRQIQSYEVVQSLIGC